MLIQKNICNADGKRIRRSLVIAGSAVLVERGGCTFTEKAKAVQAANASVMIVYNDDDGTACNFLAE